MIQKLLGTILGPVIAAEKHLRRRQLVILRYDLRTSQGVIFFESEAFRAKFNEGNSPSTF